MKVIYNTLFILLLISNSQPVQGQNINLSGNIFEYATYYVNSFDFNTGATNVQIFRYELSSDEYPVPIKVKFLATILSPALGINNAQSIIEIETDPFQ